MLIEFSVKNYRSFRDEATLSMEATGASTLKNVLIPFGGFEFCRVLLFMERMAAVKVM